MMGMEKYCFCDQESSTFFVFELWYNEYCDGMCLHIPA